MHSFVLLFSWTKCTLWLEQLIPYQYAHHQAGENPELRTLFDRLAKLYLLSVAVILVFEGSSLKHGVQVKHNWHWLEAPFKVLIHHSMRLFAPFADVLFSHFATQCAWEKLNLLTWTGRAWSMQSSLMMWIVLHSEPSMSSESRLSDVDRLLVTELRIQPQH